MRVAAHLGEYSFRVTVLVPGGGHGQVSRLARSAGLEVLVLSAGGTSAAALFQVRKLQPDVVYAVGLRAATVSRLLFAASSVRYVGAQRSVPSRRHCQLQRVFAGRTGVIIANSQAGADALVDVGLPRARVFVVLNGLLNVPAFRPGREFRCRFISVANLLPVKGHEYLLEAFESYLSEHPGATLKLVGRDERAGEIQRMVARSPRLKDAVEVCGYVEDVRSVLRESDVFVLSSLREGMPTAVLEAMAESLPVIATEVGGTPELVHHEQTGLLVPSRNAHALCEAMNRLTSNVSLRENLAAAAHQRVVRNYTFERVMEEHVRIFLSLIEGD